MPIKHAFTSAKSDGPDATLVRPSNWNADHSGLIVVRKTADEAITSSTTLQNDDHLLFAAEANSVYDVCVKCYYTGNGGDLLVAWSVPASTSGMWSGHGLLETVTGASGVISALAREDAFTTAIAFGDAVNVATRCLAVIYATIITAGTAGTVNLQTAQFASDVDATTVQAGSVLTALKV